MNPTNKQPRPLTPEEWEEIKREAYDDYDEEKEDVNDWDEHR